MYFKTFVSVAAVVAATALPLGVHAQETHVLSPQFPDTFKLRTTAVSDVQITMPTGPSGSQTNSSHGSMTWTTDTHKTADGYHGTIAIEAINMTAPNLPAVTTTSGSTTTTNSGPTTTTTADATTTTTTTTTTSSTTTTGPSVTVSVPPASPAPGATTGPTSDPTSGPTSGMSPADIQQKVTGMMKLIGNPELSYDSHMRPKRIDNLDALRGNVKAMVMMATNAQNADKVSSIFDLFLNDITPETAASFLRQSPRARLPFDKPLPLHTAVPLAPETFSLYGASLTLGGTATLDSWEDGKAAHLTLTISAPEADIHQFADTLVDAILQKAVVAVNTYAPQPATPQQGLSDAGAPIAKQIDQFRPMIHKAIDNMTLRITQTCKVDVDLTDTALTQSDCTTDFYGRIDPSKLMTAEQLKANPEAAAKLQAMVVSEKIRSVTTTTLVN